MRGQEPGSEHDRREADRTTASPMPPPSFGRIDRGVPSAFTPSGEPTDDETRVPRGIPPEPAEASTGVQPWEVAGDDSAPYDWFDDDTPDPTPSPPTSTSHPPFGTPGPATGGSHPTPGPHTSDPSGAHDSAIGGPSGTHGAFRGPMADEETITPRGNTEPTWATGTPAPASAAPGTPAGVSDPAGPPDWAIDAPTRPAWAPRAPEEPGVPPLPSNQPAWPPGTSPETGWTPEPAGPQGHAPGAPTHPAWAPETPNDTGRPHGSPSQAAWVPPDVPGRTPGTPAAWTPRTAAEATWGPQPENDTPWAAAPGQWAAAPEEDPPGWPAEPVVPGAPPWEPPPAFTAAAAGLQVWPAPVADPDVMPPWPAATGELVAEPDTDDPTTGDPAGAPTARFPTTPTGHPTDRAAAGRHPDQPPTPPTGTPTARPSEPPTSPSTSPSTAGADTTGAAATAAPADRHAPSFSRDPDATLPGRNPAPHDSDTPPYGSDAGPRRPDTTTYGGSDTGSYDPDATRPGGFPTPAHYFDPDAAKRDAAVVGQQHAVPAPPHEEHEPTAQDTPPQGMRASDPREEPTGPMRTAHYVEPHPTNPTGRPPEPGDVPVWPPTAPMPPMPPAEERRPEEGHTGGGREDAKQRTPGHSPSTPPEGTNPTDNQHETRHPADKASTGKRPEDERAEEKRADETPAADKLPDLPFNQDLWTKRPGTALDLPTPPRGTPTFPPGAFRQPPFQIPPPPPPARGKSKRALLVTLGALALAGVATGGFFAYRALNTAPPPATTAGTRPTPPTLPPTTELSASPPADVPGSSMLNSEETDPKKMSLTEAFPKKKVSAAGTTFTRVKTDTETSCDKAATGAFADALSEQKCSRIIRATYVDSKRRWAVTTGIAVLPTKEAAALTDQAKNLSRNIWFRALPGAKGSGGERVSIAGGYAAGLVWGRYIVFSYATHADGHTPDAKDKTLAKVSGAFRDQTSLVLERRVTKG
ncbi:hypothetical protein [Nonomuraea sp. NPDC052265]|uniref:hypothetical protein n=1 Tax=Nonomuraea sp. NPDC052265 TaxID=3364374 RepID=UPI0037C5CB87